MNSSLRRNRVVWSLLLSLTLIAMPSSAAAQQKKPSAPAPSKPAAAPPKPAAAPKPAEHPKPAEATKPAEAPKHEAKPAAGATGGATHAGTTAGVRTGTPATTRGGAIIGARTGGATNTTPPAAKTSSVREFREPVVVSHPGGGKSVTNAAGHTTNMNPAGKKISLETKGGTKANFDRSGYIKTIHSRTGMTISHGAHGERRFESRQPDGGRVVGFGHGRGFTERGYVRGGHPYMRRTYFSGGRRYAYAYRGYYWHGHPYYLYVSPYYYGPAYYAGAYGPWASPVAFDWGWGAAPWYGFSGYYFAPAPAYDSAALWLADYMLAANLQAAYEARAQAGAAASSDAAGGQATITPELKQLIAEEVRAQIAAEKAAADNPESAAAVSSAPPSAAESGPDQLPAALDRSQKTFVVSTVLSESMPDGTECSLSPGDILTRIQDTPDANQSVKVSVASSQRNDCAAGTQIAVAVTDLQDMHNDFRAKVSEGLATLAENQGKKGLPSGPSADSKPNPNGQAQPDLSVEAALKAQQEEASQAESDVQQASTVTPDSDD